MSHEVRKIIQLCSLQDRKAQRQLYEMYKDTLFAVVSRYIKSPHDAEDVFINGFYKILTNIDTFSGQGSFEGWMRRIIINEALMFLRKNARLQITVELPEYELAEDIYQEGEDEITYGEIMKILNELPDGYRTVFNLYVFEDYKHREIAELLGISVNTSKSQYLLAKKKILDIYNSKKNLSTKN